MQNSQKINAFWPKFLTAFGLFVICLLPAYGAKAEETGVFVPFATSTDSYVSSTLDTTTTDQSINADFGMKSSTEFAGEQLEPVIPEPKIRVGVYKTDKKVLFTSPSEYTLESNGVDLGVLPSNEVATITYSKGEYVLTSPSLTVTSSYYFRLVPGDLEEYFTIVNLERRLDKRSQLSFNTYRGIFEYRFSPKSKMPYVINELLLENYVAGIAETSNGAPDEYIKALQIAARTYAYVNISNDPPSNKNLFDVFANTNDQLYLGYNFESFSPRIAFFTAGTRGMMVTYKGKPVLTYYFSRSNGKTKNSKTQPWLKSVSCKYDKGKRMLGHGYGMSNQDAAARAKKDGWTYDQILKHYYTGVEVEKIFD